MPDREYAPGEVMPGSIVREVTAGGAITKGTFVEITPGTTPSAATYDGAAPGGVVGVALDTVASGALVRVCIEGEVSVSCDATGVDAYDYVYDGAAPGGVVGVALDNAAASGAPIRVCIEGEVTVTCDSTGVDAYDYVSSGATGLAEVGVVATDYILGYARVAGAANGVCLVHLAPTFLSASPASQST